MAVILTPKRVDALRQRLLRQASLPAQEADLAEAALLISAEQNSKLDIPAALRVLDAWARAAAPSISRASSPLGKSQALIETIRDRLGFEGNSVDYYDPQNSYFDCVLERRIGIPITLAVVYMAVGRRAGVQVHGVGFPRHFLVGIGSGPMILVDPFFGKILTEDDCQERLNAAIGPRAKLDPEHLVPATPREIIVRMLRNLKHIYLERATRSESPDEASAAADRAALPCCDRLLLLLPEDPTELRDRGLVHGRLGHGIEAYADLERALELAPRAVWAETLRTGLPALKSLAGPLN